MKKEMKKEKKLSGTTISKGLQNEIIASLHSKYKLQKLQKEWIIENIYEVFDAECPKSTRNTPIQEILDLLKAEGIYYEAKTEKYGTDTRVMADIELRNVKLHLSTSHSWSSEGDYTDINVQIFDIYTYQVQFTWTPAADVVKFLKEIDTLIQQWKTMEWPNTLLEAQKKAKMKSMSENTIKTMVAMKMKDAGIPYAFVCQKQRVKVIFNMGHNTQMEMFIPHKNFQEQIDKVIQNAKAVKQMMDETDITITMKRQDKSLSWSE